jgi:hypothetical protein
MSISDMNRCSDLKLLIEAHCATGAAAASTILRHVREVSPTPGERLHQLTAKLGPRAEEAYMTSGQMLIEPSRAASTIEEVLA